VLLTSPEKRYTHEEACAELGLKPRTVERWRTQLVRDSRGFFAGLFGGEDPPYEFVAQFAVDPQRMEADLRRLLSSY
jgi:hypothetical protein